MSEPIATPVGEAQAPAQRPTLHAELVDGPIDRALVRLAVPILFGYLAQLGFNFVNTLFMDWIGSDAQAAVGACMFVTWGMVAFGELASVGTLSLVARAIGARDPEEAGRAALAGAATSVVLGLVLVLLGPALARPIVGFMGLEAAPAALAESYLRVLFLGYPTLSIFFLLEAVCRGAGETRWPMAMVALSFVLNIVLDGLLIFGAGPLPALGVDGAAWATVLARGAGCLGLLWVLLRRGRGLGFAWPGLAPDPRRMLKVVRIGLPASLAGMGFSAIYFDLVRLTATFGTAAVAALSVGLRLEGLAYIVCAAIGRAAATLCGQCLGASRPERARDGARRAMRLACLVMAPMTVLLLVSADPVARLFATDPLVAAAAASYLRIAGAVLLALAVEVVLENVAAGVGDTLPAMVIEMAGTFLRIPIARALASTGIGSDAVWIAVAATVVIKALAFLVWFRRGTWMKV
jgi:putative MATE family efflux protein